MYGGVAYADTAYASQRTEVTSVNKNDTDAFSVSESESVDITTTISKADTDSFSFVETSSLEFDIVGVQMESMRTYVLRL